MRGATVSVFLRNRYGAPMPIDPQKVRAIDVHTHVHRNAAGEPLPSDGPEGAVAKVFGNDALLSVSQLADFYREREMACVAFFVDLMNAIVLTLLLAWPFIGGG